MGATLASLTQKIGEMPADPQGTRPFVCAAAHNERGVKTHLALIYKAPSGTEMEMNMSMFRNIAGAAVVVAGTFANNAAFAHERWVDFVNVSDVGVTDLQIANLDDLWWGPNLLNDTLPAGYHVVVNPMNPQGYCRFDIRLTYSDGTISTINDVNLCDSVKIVSNGSTYDVYTI